MENTNAVYHVTVWILAVGLHVLLTSTGVTKASLSSITLHPSEENEQPLFTNIRYTSLHITPNESCTNEDIVKQLTVSPQSTQVVDVHIHLVTSSYCWLLLKAPQHMVVSVLLLRQSCDVKGSVKVAQHFSGDQADRHWHSCQRMINPGEDYLSPGSQVYVGFTSQQSGVYRATLNVLATDRQDQDEIHTRYVTPKLGYIQTRGIHLQPVIFLKMPNVQTYGDNMDVWSTLTAPLNHAVFITVAIASFERLKVDQMYEDRLELYKGSNKTMVWTLCSRYRQLPAPNIIEDETVNVHFISGSGDTTSENPLKHGNGFRLVFSFHQKTAVPSLLSSTKWNCSVSYWPEFEGHFRCNLLTECDGGEDEDHCPYTPCANNGVLIARTCYTMHIADTGITWHHANALCSDFGGQLAAIRTDALKRKLIETLRLDLVVKSGHTILVGARTSDTNMFLYRNLDEWADGTIAYHVFMTQEIGNSHTRLGLLYPVPYGVAMTYFKSAWKIQEECSHFMCAYLCERKIQGRDNTEFHGEVTELGASELGNSTTISLTPVNSSSIVFPKVPCPLGHVTHTFLALDGHTQCFPVDAYEDYDCESSLHSSSSFCRFKLHLLPPPFQCFNGMQQVPYSLVCDHIHDCVDNTDETLCHFPECVFPHQLKCQNSRQCLPIEAKCDKFPNCTNGADELDCSPSYNTLVDTHVVYPPFIVTIETIDGFPRFHEIDSRHWKPCPVTHFQCPGDKNCLPVYLRCNGVLDCSHREDEMGCETYTCPGFYRCRASTVCVHPNDVCDQMPHCPQHDDERFCNVTCAHSCTCHGYSFSCRHSITAERFPQLRYLDAKDSGMKLRQVAENYWLIHLGFSECGIISFENVSLPNLVSFDLSHNQIEVLCIDDLAHFPNLRSLRLTGNPLSSLSVHPGSAEHKLIELIMSQTYLHNIHLDMLEYFPGLQTLNLSYAKIEHVEGETVQTLPKTLRVLDFQGCPVKTFPRTMFKGLDKLQAVHSDNFKLCCPVMLPEEFNTDKCYAPFNEISSCEDLLHSNIYRVPLSVLACLSLLGNSVSFLARMLIKKGKKTSGFTVFVLHLCFSDFLMGVYLVFIGAADRVYQGRYLWQDTSWRHSVACKLAGFVSMMSSEVSAFIICLITLDRFIVLRFPFSHMRFEFLSAQLISVAAWVLGMLLAMIPVLPATSHWQFYSQTGICIPLPVTRNDFAGHGYALGVMIVLNFVLFLLVASGQAFVYFTIQSSKMSESETSRKSQDATIARRLITIVVSDFLCWFPIGLLGLLAASGTPIPGEVNVAMAIFVLPLNSALNPFLYTLNMIQEHTAKRKEDKLFRKLLLQKDTFVDNANSK